MAKLDTPITLHGFDLGGHFVDLRPLGVGVTGLVLSAVDQRTGQRVAIKKLVMRDVVTVKHALREVKITQRLRHENVVRVHEVAAPFGRPLPRDPTQLGALYIVQECMETDLARLLERGPLDTGREQEEESSFPLVTLTRLSIFVGFYVGIIVFKYTILILIRGTNGSESPVEMKPLHCF